MQILGAYRSALRQFDLRVGQIRDDQWAAATPCSEWDVRELVDHLVTEQLWAPPLLAGRTIAEVEAAADFGGAGGNLGDDPAGAWAAAREAAAAAVDSADPDRIVHLSFGDLPARVYLEQLTFDLLVHAWDLARAIGADSEMPNDTTAFVLDVAKEQVPMAAGAGVFAPAIPVPGCTDDLTELLALTGRHRWWTPGDPA